MTVACEACAYFDYDDALDDYLCTALLDEDEYIRLLEHGGACPYFRPGDDYELVRHQN